jgi:hypothetical protein
MGTPVAFLQGKNFSVRIHGSSPFKWDYCKAVSRELSQEENQNGWGLRMYLSGTELT